jgi:2-polyprenyl-6-methoxyphenol hydroxylase-like FAD-dependent oxidoreductase
MGSLLAARILSDFFMWVTIIERDEFPAPGEQRKGVPQGKHAHGLHARGREIPEQLFPGFTDEMVAQGSVKLDISQDFRWFSAGGFHQPCPSGLLGLLVSRPRIEAHVRTRMLALPNVRSQEGCSVLGVVASESHSCITGIRLARHGDAPEEIIEADLVVDASGRGSRSSTWLAELGYEEPQEERVKIDLQLYDMRVSTHTRPTERSWWPGYRR